MRKFNDILSKYNLKPLKYNIHGKVTIISTNDEQYVIKEKNRNANKEIYKYLKSRSFNYYPRVLSDNDDDYEIIEYIEDIDIPKEQKLLDLIDLVSLLHNKTTHYKEIDEDDYKKIYEDINNNIDYLNSYYDDIMSIIESKVYMSPSEYLLARNISKIYSALNYSKTELEVWYKLIKEKRKQRVVVLHNNLDISHFLRNENSYLINWDKSKIDIPIFDLYKLYRRHGYEYNFSDILKRYEKNYPLKEEERKLLFILISLPDKIEFNKSNYKLCEEISEKIDILYRTDELISPYYSKD